MCVEDVELLNCLEVHLMFGQLLVYGRRRPLNPCGTGELLI